MFRSVFLSREVTLGTSSRGFVPQRFDVVVVFNVVCSASSSPWWCFLRIRTTFTTHTRTTIQRWSNRRKKESRRRRRRRKSPRSSEKWLHPKRVKVVLVCCCCSGDFCFKIDFIKKFFIKNRKSNKQIFCRETFPLTYSYYNEEDGEMKRWRDEEERNFLSQC